MRAGYGIGGETFHVMVNVHVERHVGFSLN
jgi:hypothetical protein